MAEGDAGRGPPRSDRHAMLLILPFAILFLVCGIVFARAQNVWIDETTQLLGSALPFGRMMAWLAGAREALGVPPDRMPPISYFVDFAWHRVVGDGDFGFRLLHLLAALAGVVALLRLVARRYGALAVIVAGGLLALTPQMTSVAVEIRAYPLFFAVAAWQVVAFYRLYDAGPLSVTRLVLFTAVGLLAVYTHFFGLVASSAFFSALLVTRARSRRDLVAIACAWAVLLVASAGLMPFIGGAVSASDTAAAPAGGVSAFVLYLLRLLGHPSIVVTPVLAALYFAALAALIGAGIVRALPRRITLADRLSPEAGVAIAIAAGLVATFLASLVARGFEPLKPTYSIWLWPAITVLAASGAARGLVGRWRPAIAVPVAVLTIALIAIQIQFLRHATWFVHGPERAIVERLGPQPADTAIVYDDDQWGYAYFPLIYRYGRALPQYRMDRAGNLRLIGPGGDGATAPVPTAELQRYRRIIHVAIALRTFRDLRGWHTPADEMSTFATYPSPLPPGPQWSVVRTSVTPGLYSLRMTEFARVAADDRD